MARPFSVFAFLILCGGVLLPQLCLGETLSPSQIAGLWKGSNCATAVAVALAESSGNCKAQNVNKGGSIDRGLWQINNYYHSECSDSCAYDCTCNAGCAKSVSSGGSNWQPWSTYNSGAYKSHLAAAEAACSGPGPSPGPPPGPGGCNTCVAGGGGQSCLPECGTCGSSCTSCIKFDGGKACADRCCPGKNPLTGDASQEADRMAAFMEKWGPAGYNVVEMVGENDENEDEKDGGRRLQGPPTPGGGPFQSLFNIIQQITSAWQSIVNAFKSSYSEQIVDKEFNNGWDKFKAATKTFKGAGLEYNKTDEFFADIRGMIQIPPEYAKDFDDQIKWIKFFDNTTWSSHNTQYSAGKSGGSDTLFTMFARNRQDDEKLDVLFLTCSQEFHKADNYFVISESKSILGGIWSSTTLKFKKIPAGITDQDLMFVADYFQLLAYQQIALAAGEQAPPDPQFPTGFSLSEQLVV